MSLFDLITTGWPEETFAKYPSSSLPKQRNPNTGFRLLGKRNFANVLVDVFGNHSLGGLLKEGTHEKSPKCLSRNLGDFGEFWGILQRSLVVKVSSYFNKQFVPSSFILHIQANAS